MSNNHAESITQAEHLSTLQGENIDAKKVANYGYDSSNSQWRRMKVDANGKQEVSAELAQTIYKQIEAADDNITTINYVSSAKTDVSTIVQSSASVGHTATETFNNSGATTLVITRTVV